MRSGKEIKSLAASFKHAFSGVLTVIKTERNFRIHICMMLYVLAFSAIGQVSRQDILRFVLCFGMVFSAELFNTALELVCNLVSDRFDIQIRAIKDISAAAVLLTAISSAVVGLITFLDGEVFFRIVSALYKMPYIAPALLLSLPFAFVFITGRKKK